MRPGLKMSSFTRQLRTLLVLGRVSNLPTVWSNCLAAWLLNGGVPAARILWLCAGATLLYTGGMFLNDAFDEGFDRRHCSERPIPSGRISLRLVWVLGFGLLVCGWLLLLPLGAAPAINGVLLAAMILVYDAVHKRTGLAPLLMAACRFLLYAVAAAAAHPRLGAVLLWHGLALAAYVAGLSFLARTESNGGFVGRWPLLLLAAPLVANLTVNPARPPLFWVAGGCLAIWLWRCVRSRAGGVGRMVAGLLAGIALVDWSAAAHVTVWAGFVFAGCFLMALVFQRKVPAT